jgi:glycosyltransferase involved in cell wall biosynthesis
MGGRQQLPYVFVDNCADGVGVPTEALTALEERLLRRADVVLVSAERLLRSKARINPRIALVRHGVDFNHFRRSLDPKTEIPADLAALPGPVIGYFGLIAQDWIDVDLLAHVAQRFPHASLVLLGKVTMGVSALERFPNVHFLGRKPYATLPSYCKGFDVALIPFPVSAVTLNANPLKAREYLAAGLPVVSTPIPEVAVLGQCLIGSTASEFADLIEGALAVPGPAIERSESMRRQSWQARLHEIDQHLTTLLDSGARGLSVVSSYGSVC